MRIRVKEKGLFGIKRTESRAKIDDILVKEDLMHPERENIHIFFRGRDSSGILNLNKNEARSLVNSINPVLKLLKSGKIGKR